MTIKSINAVELRTKLEAGEELLLIDCRETDEWDAGHIEQAEFLPLSEFSDAPDKLADKKDSQIIIQCRSGKRSMNACRMLEENGFNNLTNLEGGILGWSEEGYPIKTE